MRRSRLLAISAAVLTAVTLNPHPAAAAPGDDFDLSPGMLSALRRDLQLDDRQIAARLRTEAAAPAVERHLRTRLGSAFAGAWIPAGGQRLTVAVTDQ